MPVLCEETSIFPEDLLDVPPGDSGDAAWWVLYTKSRQEKAVARHLLAHEVPFYVPVVKRTLTYRGRRVTSRVPLFAGYVFDYWLELIGRSPFADRRSALGRTATGITGGKRR